MRVLYPIAIVLLAAIDSSVLAQDGHNTPVSDVQLAADVLVPGSVKAFRLPDVDEKVVEVAMCDGELTVVCFLGTECPLAKLYAPRLAKLSQDYANVNFVGVNSNVQDSREDVAEYAERYSIPFPMLKDHRNQVADQFRAVRTPEVYLLDDQLRVLYRGRIDDQYQPGLSKSRPAQQDLRVAIEESSAGKSVSTPLTTAVGCFIGRVKQPVSSSGVTYTNQVSRVLQKNCIECHREGEIGPFALEDYEEVVGWADTIIEVIDDGRMPPWHASPDHGEFANARHMSDHDKTILRKWVDAGMPYGDAASLPQAMKHTDGWRLPHEPDQVLSMSETEFEVPADGTVEYQYFVVDPGFKEDKWITGAQIVPGNPAVVHHSIAFVRPPDGSRFRGIGWLTAYVPGSRAGTLPAGGGIFVPAKSKIVFQQHYTPNGMKQSDVTTIGLTFGKDEDITHEVYTLVGIDQEFEIPPHTKAHTVSSQVDYLPPHAELLAIMPHMHLRGKSFRLHQKKDGQRSILLDVPNYDFNWQHAYRLKSPLKLSDVDKLEFDVVFDNSEGNPVNPNPAEHVSWGDQTWEEMAVAFFEVIEPRVKPTEPDATVLAVEQGSQRKSDIHPEKKARMAAEADRILARFDTDKDGVVARDETSFAFRRVFGQIDENRDGKLTRAEIESAARYRVK